MKVARKAAEKGGNLVDEKAASTVAMLVGMRA